MKLIIAEKPSVARELANVLGANNKNEGYFEGNGYVVSFAYGHLLQLADASIYDETYKKWCLDDLPIVPENFKLVINKSSQSQYNVLNSLFNRTDIDEIICATDAGREGELIFRHIYNYSGCKKPFKRLWISSLTEDSILNGMASLRDSKEFDNLYQSAFARAKADWLFGINFSRLFSLKNNMRLPVGRVQTPTLHMIVKRDLEVENFIKEKFFVLKMSNGAYWIKDNIDRFNNKDEAEAIKKKCTGKTAFVSDVKKEKKSENRPLLYSLTSLQQEANKKLGFSAQKTLNIVQKLYEAKLTTYPRTDSNYLSDDMKDDVVSVLQILSDTCKNDMATSIIQSGLNLDSRIFNNAKVTDHHAIIPTKDIYKMDACNLSSDEKAVLSLIINRFIIIFSVPHIYDLVTYVFSVENETFRLSVKKVLQEGFKRYLKDDVMDEENAVSDDLSFELDDTFVVDSLSVLERFTKPKKHFTDASLLSVMENIDRQIEDDSLKQYVKERGLGTPATRAGIIEKLIQTNYVERKGKYLVSSPLGRKFIDAIPSSVKDVDLTAEWEQVLLDIEKGSSTEQILLDSVIQHITSVTTLTVDSNDDKIVVNKDVIGVCPRCGKSIFENDKSFYCEGYKDDPKCSFSIWKNDKFFVDRGKKITKQFVSNLLKNEKVLVKGFKKKDGKGSYDAFVSLQDTGTYVNFSLSFPSETNNSIGFCPRCGKNVFENDKSFYCEGYKDDPKCSFSIWKNDKFFVDRGKKITKQFVSNLLKNEKVLVKGLNTKSGDKSYDAYIMMNDTGKYVNFEIAEYVNKK